jgi:hypothetical protein
MAKSYTFEETVPFKYRFVCEHCGKQTNWLKAKISDQKTVEVGFFDDAGLKKQEFRDGFHKYTYPDKKAKIINGKYNESEEMKGICPKCGMHQSWESSTTRIGTWIGMFVTCLIVGLFCLSVLLSKTSSPGFPVILIGGACLLCVPVSLIFLIRDLVKRAKISEDSSKTKNRNKPEFEFSK